jgi:hypothetical protein
MEASNGVAATIDPINPLAPDRLDEKARELVRRDVPVASLWFEVRRKAENGTRPLALREPYTDYDEAQVVRRLYPGDYDVELITLGVKMKGVQARVPLTVTREAGKADPPPSEQPRPIAPALAALPSDPNDRTAWIMEELREARRTNNELMLKLIDRQQQPAASTATTLKELVGVVGILRGWMPRAEREPAGDSGMGEVFKQLLGAFLQDRAATPAAPPRTEAPKDQTAAPALPPSQDAQGGLVTMLRQLGALLMVGAKAAEPQPVMYAGVIADALENAGADVPVMLAGAGKGELIDALAKATPELEPHRAFVGLVADALAELYAEDADTHDIDDDGMPRAGKPELQPKPERAKKGVKANAE